MTTKEAVTINGMMGHSSRREVFLGFAPASTLHRLSFADVLNEDTGRGYQRRFNPQHSLDFRKYIQKAGSSTIPLTFNLRPRTDHAWRLVEDVGGVAVLRIPSAAREIISQVA